MTIVYFVRHAQSDMKIHDEASRPLTDKGMKERVLVTSYLQNRNIDIDALDRKNDF